MLQRKTGQVIHIGDDVEVVVLSVSGDQVRLGIEAPRAVRVLRGELLGAIEEENRLAASPPSVEGVGAALGALSLRSGAEL
ncbi:MAG TPA: carbon storage regulator [Chloroflexota bacterium]|nr:carbon storage regulator [Chloroflexota bacterium]